MRQTSSLSIIAFALLLLAGCNGSANPPKQSAEAQLDIQRGHLELRGYGKPTPWVPTYAQLLKDRLGVSYVSVAGCVVTEQLVNETDAYNAAMTREVERRYGAGILEKLADQASKTYAATRPAA